MILGAGRMGSGVLGPGSARFRPRFVSCVWRPHRGWTLVVVHDG